jgi:menaquinone-9 beta-reductase
MSYDLIIIGGGLAGSALAIAMARQGASVLILEQEDHFRDRIRGEGVHVWGTVEARALGLYAPLLERCARELPFVVPHKDGVPGTPRDLPATTPAGSAMLSFYHPEMQECLMELARESGVRIWRSARVTGLRPGGSPRVCVNQRGEQRELTARLVVGADGRRSSVRRWGGFTVQRDPENLRIAGALVSGIPADEHALSIFRRTDTAWNTQFIPLGRGRYRCYFVSGDRARHPAFGGTSGTPAFVANARDSGVLDAWLQTLRIDGPLATFEAASWWVDRPYRNGVALVGDAAAAPDPCFGNGLSLALRDARVLSQHLLTETNWADATEGYAEDHDAYFGALHRLEQWCAQAWYSVGPDRQHIRAHAATAEQDGHAPDIPALGPDQPSDDAARMQFLGY